MTTRYTAIFEQGSDGSWGAYVPDLPGIACGAASREETESLVREAIVMYLEELKESGELVPPPSVQAVEIEVAA